MNRSLNFARRKRRLFFILAIGLQFCFLLALMWPSFATIARGDEIVVHAMPVDPWDLFRGDYITIEYGFSRIKSPGAGMLNEFKAGSPVFVVLSKSGGTWVMSRVVKEPCPLASGQIGLKGRVKYASDDEITVHYGLERVYIEEGRGRQLSDNAGFEVKLVVDRGGHGVIKEVRHREDVLYSWRKFL